METYDCIVAGGGIAGSFFAYLSARNGKRVLLLEKLPIMGEKVCGGGVSYKALDLLEQAGIDVSLLFSMGAQPIQGHRYVWLDGHQEMHHYSHHRYSMGVSRNILDCFLQQQANSAGAVIRLGMPVTQWAIKNGHYVIGESRAPHFIAAIGAYDWNGSAPKGQSAGMSSLISGCSTADPTIFQFFYYGRQDDRYGWVFPIGENLWNVGIWQRTPQRSLRDEFNQFMLQTVIPFFPKGWTYRTKPHGALLGHIDQRNAFLCNGIGDFSGKNNRKNGGGIVGALQSAWDLSSKIFNS